MDYFTIFMWFAMACILAIFVLRGFYKYKFRYWKSRNIPCENPSIPFGNTDGFGKTIHPAYFFKTLYDQFKSTGKEMCGAYFYFNPWAVLINLELVKNVLINDFAYFNERGSYHLFNY